MKTATIYTLAAFAMAASSASSMELGDLIGSWSGKRTETKNGIGVYAKATFTGKRGSDGGLIMVEKADTPTWGMVTNRHEFHKGGRYRIQGNTTFGFIILSGSGTWKISQGEIVVSGTAANTAGTTKFSGHLKLVDQKHFRYSGKSGGTKVVLAGAKL